MADPLIGAIRANYDRLAQQYVVHLFEELQDKPFDRELLTRFAEQTTTRGNVCDIGCGPGHVTRFLHELHVPVFGIDLSPVMVGEARRRNPGLEFREGDMMALDLAPNSLVGIVAFYAIVNLPERASRTLTLNTKVDARTSLDANAHSHTPRKVISQRTTTIVPYCSDHRPCRRSPDAHGRCRRDRT